MQLPALSLRNQAFVYVLIAITLFLGIRAFVSIPKAEDPALTLPNYTVIAVYPGTSPTDMEDLVVDPIEEVIDALDDIKEIRTEITNGLAIVKVEAEFGIDIDDKYDEILAEVNGIRSELPERLYELRVEQFKPEDRVVVQQYALTSETASYRELRDLAEALQDQLETLDGVKRAEIEAAPREEVRVSLDFQKMAQLGVSLNQVLGVFRGNNANVPGGEVQAGALSFNIQSTGGYSSLADIAETAIGATGQQIVYLRDFATVTPAEEDVRWRARHNGQRCVFVSVTKKKEANLLHLDDALATATAGFSQQLPVGVAFETAFEQASAVEARLNDFISNLLQGIALVGVIIWLFLGWRAGLIVMTVVPLSIVLAITTLDFSGYALQQISIAALVIALGLLVDNAIVVIENIVRFRQEGHSLAAAAAKGTAEVSYAIVSATITTVLAFAPLAMLESGPGEFLRTLPLTVIFALGASLLLALTFTPIVSSKVLRRRGDAKGTWLARRIEAFVGRFYRPTLWFVLRRGWVPVAGGLVLLLGAVSLFPSIGVSFFPTADKSLLLVSVDLPYTANVDRTDRALRYVESILDTTAYVDHYTVSAGHGNPQVYYNRIPENFKQYHGEVMVNFKAWDPARFYRTLDGLRVAFDRYPDARITFRELTNGAPFEAPVEIILLGENLDTLRAIAGDIEQVVARTEGTQDVENALARAKTDVAVNVNRDKAALYQVSLLDLDQTVRASLNGLEVDEVTLKVDNETYPVVLRLPYTDQPTVDDLGKVYVMSRTGHRVPLSQLASVDFEADFAKISHFNTVRFASVTANVTRPDQTKAITEAIIPALDAYDWPTGYRYYLGGEYETQQESFGDLGILLAVALLAIFAVLVLQFRSLVQPLIIFSAIPLAVTGSFVALFLTGWSFSFFAFVGFISLIGIVVNNSIILVDYTNQLMSEGVEKLMAIQQAAERRFTPILLTTLTTILGLVPLTVSGTSLWSPLGWTLIGGLLSSMLLTLLVVPVLYRWFTPRAATA